METSETESARASGGSVDSEGSFDVNSSVDISGRLMTSVARSSPAIRVQMMSSDDYSFDGEMEHKMLDGLPGVKVLKGGAKGFMGRCINLLIFWL